MALRRATVEASRPPALCRTMRVAPRVDPLRARVWRRAARARAAATGSDAATAAPPAAAGDAAETAQPRRPAASSSAAADGDDAGDASKRPVPPAQRVDLAEPRARPVISTVLYYITLGTYVAYFATTSLVGPDAADAVVLRLANEHAAVAEGDVLRLFTSSFAATESLYQLGLYLVAMLTLGAELEGIFGPELFWATYALSAVAGGFADAALPAAVTAGADGLPRLVTQGPAPAVAGMVGALLVHTARNWRFESAVEALRKRISENRPLPPWLGLRPLVDVGQAGSLAAAVAAADAAGPGAPTSSVGAIRAVAAVSKLRPTSSAVEKAAVAAVASAAVADNPLALLPVVVSSFSLSRKAAPVVSPAAAAAAAAAASSSMDEEQLQQQQQQADRRPGLNGAASAAIAAAVAASSSPALSGGGGAGGAGGLTFGAYGGSVNSSLDGEEDDPLHDEPGGLTTAEVDLFMGYSASFLVPRDVQAIVRAAGTGGAALRALVDAFASGGGADSLTSSTGTGDGGVSVAGLAAGALAGCVLGYAFSPTYELARRPIDHRRDDDSGGAGGGGGGEASAARRTKAGAKTKPAEASGRRRKDGPLGGLMTFGSFAEGLGGAVGEDDGEGGGGGGGSAKAPRPLFGEGAPTPTVDDEVVVVDVRDAERGRAAVGFAALLYVAIAAWLIGPAAYLEGG